MSQGQELKVLEERRLLVERIARSPYLSRSARLRDLLVYLTDRVLEDDALDIREHEVGHKVFGRAPDYDTAADNIVRVHASMLRKRLEQYFAGEGASESIVVEIPKGNYAPVFRERGKSVPALLEVESLAPPPSPAKDHRLLAAAILAVAFAAATAVLLYQRSTPRAEALSGPVVRQFWSQVFLPGRPTDVVLDDSAVGLYQELTGHALSLTEYYDRSYLRSIPAVAAGSGLDAQLAASMLLRRQSSFAGTSFSWRLLQLAAAAGGHATLRFARDYSFRELKADTAILLGNDRSNPWIQPFEPKLGLRWQFEKTEAVYYPVDTREPAHSYLTGQPGETHEGYFSIALLPNLGGTGNVLLISATGGSATNSAADFLTDERWLSELRLRLPASADGSFPPFEALIKARGRSGPPHDVAIVFCRPIPA